MEQLAAKSLASSMQRDCLNAFGRCNAACTRQFLLRNLDKLSLVL